MLIIENKVLEHLTIDIIGNLTADEVPDKEEILKGVLENENIITAEISGDVRETISADSILGGLQLGKKLGNYFVKNDHNSAGACKFQADLTVCMALIQVAHIKI